MAKYGSFKKDFLPHEKYRALRKAQNAEEIVKADYWGSSKAQITEEIVKAEYWGSNKAQNTEEVAKRRLLRK